MVVMPFENYLLYKTKNICLHIVSLVLSVASCIGDWVKLNNTAKGTLSLIDQFRPFWSGSPDSWKCCFSYWWAARLYSRIFACMHSGVILQALRYLKAFRHVYNLIRSVVSPYSRDVDFASPRSVPRPGDPYDSIRVTQISPDFEIRFFVSTMCTPIFTMS